MKLNIEIIIPEKLANCNGLYENEVNVLTANFSNFDKLYLVSPANLFPCSISTPI